MNSTTSYLKSQYELVQRSRKVLFAYCETITDQDLRNENSAFGRGGSVRNLLVHIANAYEFWIVKNALQKDIVFTKYTSKNTIDDIQQLFADVDREVLGFISTFGPVAFDQMHLEINGIARDVTAFELFTHVITHEFHHKGQILSLSRHLGYVPVDTDIIR